MIIEEAIKLQQGRGVLEQGERDKGSGFGYEPISANLVTSYSDTESAVYPHVFQWERHCRALKYLTEQRYVPHAGPRSTVFLIMIYKRTVSPCNRKYEGSHLFTDRNRLHSVRFCLKKIQIWQDIKGASSGLKVVIFDV